MNFFLEPLFWGITSIFLLLLVLAQESVHHAQKKIFLKVFLAVLFLLNVFMMVKIEQQPRFFSGGWHQYSGIFLILLSLSLFALSSVQLIRHSNGKSYLSNNGIYTIIRNPLHLGIFFLILGLAIIYRSIYGLMLLPFWIAGLFLHIKIQEQNFQIKAGLSYLKYKRKVKRRFFPKINTSTNKKEQIFPFKNLVFKGGGVKGIAYKGVLQVLSEYEILDQAERVAGTSAGAITAMILSLRLSIDETIQLIDSLKFAEIPEKLSPDEIPVDWTPLIFKKEIDEISGNIESLRRLTKKFGWYSSNYFYQWLKNIIAQHCDGNGMATFEEFQQRGFRELHVVATNISKYSGEVFSVHRTPRTAVADAVRMSMSIPLYFEAMRYNGIEFGDGDYYADGGMYNNYPIQIFDSPFYSKNNPWYSNGINWETIGFFLYPLEEFLSREKEITDVIIYIERLLDNMAQASEITAMQASTIDDRRTVKISDCNVAPTDFHIDINHIKYHELVRSGRDATKTFLDQFLTPEHLQIT